MKSIKLLALMLFLSGSVMAQKMINLQVSWVYTNVIEGYDHPSKSAIYIDGREVAVSTVKKQTQKNSITIPVAAGSHEIRIVNLSEYDGVWEEHTEENNYSLDAIYETTLNFKKKPRKIDLIFDIDTEETTAKVK
jgi:hypothetical protein